MAASSTTSGMSVGFSGAGPHAAVHRRRQVTPAAGHALEILGHAIEYLTDEFVHDGANFCAQDGRVEAVQLLMGINRQIYFDCPVAPTLGERWRSLLRLRAA
jgi:hypothetical protein